MSGLLEIVGSALGALASHPLVGIGVRLFVVYLLVLWLAAAWWTWRDARLRTADPLAPYVAAGVVVLATPLLFALAVGVYRVVRPSTTRAERESAELQQAVLAEEAETVRCPACQALVEPEWVACPSCGQALAGRVADWGPPPGLHWGICPGGAAEGKSKRLNPNHVKRNRKPSFV